MSNIKAEYQKEYKRYSEMWKGYPLITPSFLDHLRERQRRAGQLKNWKKYELLGGLIQYDREQDDDREPVADYQGSDADPGL